MEVHKLANSNVSVIKPKRTNPSNDNRRIDYVKKIHKRRLTAIGIAFALVICVLGFQIFNAHQAYSKTVGNIEVSQKKLDKQRATKSDLKVEKAQLNNKSYLEKYIREKYMYSKPGEQVYNLPDATNTFQK
ncbi:FtsB family cell division protein [Companilactobacillus baiquanensis]|uniref:Septum formation initiator family protein n=1 Tax=Companilactobacillus baiquanensis TaxID=2486005 RepID=A0ABW1UTM7_9LACO|nr:septum formation initiator family protein [Companilactobacillus baiquanensis]